MAFNCCKLSFVIRNRSKRVKTSTYGLKIDITSLGTAFFQI